MASAGYPWTVNPVGERNTYLNTLEKASVGQDIVPFADCPAGLVRTRPAGSVATGSEVYLMKSSSSVARDQVGRKKRI